MPYIIQDHDAITHKHQPINQYVFRVRDMAPNDKPREKLLRYGPSGLSSAELIAVLLSVGTRHEDVLAMSRRILKEYGDRAIIHETSPQKLANALSIPQGKAIQLVACFEIGQRSFARHNGKPRYIRTAQHAYEYVVDMASGKKEQLRGLYLNAQYEIIHDEVISVGSLTASIVHPREVFQPAVEYGAVAVIVAHNHPSGVLDPTDEDHAVTAQLVEAGKTLGIELLDHLIVTGNGHLSLVEGAL